MELIDRKLENLVKEVELYGRSAADSVYLTDASFVVERDEYSIPQDASWDGATVDFMWFMDCADKGISVPHLSPDKSFWLHRFGKDAEPYGVCWRLKDLYNNLRDPTHWRRCMLWNSRASTAPPCVLCYQFMENDHHTLDLTITMRSCDVVKCLPQDILMSHMLLQHVCKEVGFDYGKMTFNIANAHVYWEDTFFQEEFTFDQELS